MTTIITLCVLAFFVFVGWCAWKDSARLDRAAALRGDRR
jgi:hypothetical protein